MSDVQNIPVPVHCHFRLSVYECQQCVTGQHRDIATVALTKISRAVRRARRILGDLANGGAPSHVAQLRLGSLSHAAAPNGRVFGRGGSRPAITCLRCGGAVGPPCVAEANRDISPLELTLLIHHLAINLSLLLSHPQFSASSTMSGPYDYNQGYQQGYPPQQGYAQQPSYPLQQSYQQYPPQQQGYPSQPPDPGFAPPRRADSFGPPAAGGFQHGQRDWQAGSYGASNPQGHPDYYGYNQPQQHQQYGGAGQDAYAQNQAYQASMSQPSQGQYGQEPPQIAPQSSDPNAPNYDPNAPPMSEQDRGLLGGLGGAWAGHHFGKKQGHGLIGTVVGGLLGSFAEDKVKDYRRSSHHHHGSQGSSWGGSSYGRY